MAYSLTKIIPSCLIERKLLLDLENYIQRKTADSSSSEDFPTRRTYKFAVVDSSGMETLNSVGEFQRNYFPDDTLRIKLEGTRRGNESLNIEITFAIIKDLSKLEIQYDGASAREVTAGIASEVFSILGSYETSNKWWHLFPGTITMLLIGALLTIVFSIDKELLAKIPAVASITLGAVGVLIMLQIIPAMLPYSTFETRKNEKRKKRISWIVLGVLGFILFTVMGVYFRQKLFGF